MERNSDRWARLKEDSRSLLKPSSLKHTMGLEMCPQNEQWILKQNPTCDIFQPQHQKGRTQRAKQKGRWVWRAVHINEMTCSVPCGCAKGFKRPSVETASVKVQQGRGLVWRGALKFLHVQEHGLEGLWGTLSLLSLLFQRMQVGPLRSSAQYVYAVLLDSVILQKTLLSLPGRHLAPHLKGRICEADI